MSMNKGQGKTESKTLKIQGMTCGQCEKTLQKALSQVEGVSKVEVSFKAGTARIVYDLNGLAEETFEQRVALAIQEAGYEVLSNAKGMGVLTPLQMAGVGVVLAALYLLIHKTVGFNFIPELQTSMSYGMLFAVGLLTSLHCIAMCGGINLSQCLKPRQDGTFTAGWKPSFLYNSGRVISYTLVGGVAGGLGSVVSFSGNARGLVAILAGLFMVIMGINMLGLVPALKRFQIQMPAGFRKTLLGKNNDRGPLVVGLLNGLMPCGPLQAMQLYALGTGSVAAGAFSMFFFSLGTVPLMFGFGAISTLLSKRFTRNMLKFSAVLVILLGVIMMQRGIGLSGTPYTKNTVEPQSVETVVAEVTAKGGSVAKVEKGVQNVQVEVGSNSYPEIVVQKGVKVSFNLHAAQSNLNGCNRSIVIPDFDVKKDLQPGDNVVEFTPTQTGVYGYTCWMGMIRSKITVVEDLKK